MVVKGHKNGTGIPGLKLGGRKQLLCDFDRFMPLINQSYLNASPREIATRYANSHIYMGFANAAAASANSPVLDICFYDFTSAETFQALVQPGIRAFRIVS